MKKVIVMFTFLSLISSVLAHTGNDAIDHMPTTSDLLVGCVILGMLIVLMIWLIRKINL